MSKPINIIFDGPPGPESGRFVEVETDDCKSINIGEWTERQGGCWALRITELPGGDVKAENIAAVMMMAAHGLSPQEYETLEDILRNICDAHNISNEALADIYIKLSGKKKHTLDCATSQAPAHIPGPCNCDTKE